MSNPITMLAEGAAQVCEANPILSALAEGIAHTDIGLTIATIILAVITWNLIDDAKQERIRHHFQPWHHMHGSIDSSVDSPDGHSQVHTEFDIDRE
jgi:hypothetical protein